jgi:hypothetical protein
MRKAKEVLPTGAIERWYRVVGASCVTPGVISRFKTSACGFCRLSFS